VEIDASGQGLGSHLRSLELVNDCGEGGLGPGTNLLLSPVACAMHLSVDSSWLRRHCIRSVVIPSAAAAAAAAAAEAAI